MLRSRWAAVGVGVIGITANLGACSLFTDLDSFSDGVDAARGDGAGPNGLEGGTSSDAPANGGEGGDGGNVDTDTGSNVDANGPRFCDVQSDGGAGGAVIAYCKDFDHPNDDVNDPFWTTKYVDAKGALSLSGPSSGTGALSLKATLGRRNNANDDQTAALRKIVSTEWKRTVLEFDLRLANPNWQVNDVNSAFLEVDFSGAQNKTLYFVIGRDYTQLSDGTVILNWGGSTTGPSTVQAAFVYDQFNHIKIDINPKTNAISASINGITKSDTLDWDNTVVGTGIAAVFGIVGFNTPCPDLTTNYDNIILTFP